MAKLSFSNAYRINTGTTPAAKEANSADFIFTPLNVTRIDDRSAGQNFSGNDVVVELQVDGQIYYGWISRPVKSGGVVRGFYFWTDPQFTSLAAATADGNADGDGNSADNFGFVLVVDQAWFNALPAIGANVKNAGTSSDRVDNGLNALMPVNSAPAPMNDSVSFMEDGGAQGGNVLSNDSDANGDGLTVSGYSIGGVAGTLGVAHTIAGVGSFTLNADGAYTFAPADDYAGPVPLISYSMADGRGGTGAASLSISVAQANDAPSGADKTITARENIGHTFTAADFGFSDSTDSVANSLLSVTIATAPNAADGTLTLNGVTVGAGDSIAAADITSLKFIPAPDRSGLGLASFTFQVRDNGGGAGDTDLTPNTIIFNVSNVNSAPGAVADTARATEGGAGTAGSNPSGNLLANDTDPDAGDLKTVDSASGAGSGATAIGASNAIAGSFGTLTLSSDGSYAYALDNTSTAVQALRSSAQTLTDTFSYTMKDGAGLRSTASMTVTIEGRNDGPVALNDFNFAVASNVVQAKLNPSGKLLANDSDVDAGDAISVTRASAGSTLGGAIVTIGSGTSVQGAEGRTYAGFSTKGAGNIGSVGATVTGTGVPAGTTVASVDNVSGTRFVTFANAYGNVAALDGVASITVNGNLFTLEPLGAPSTTIIAISGATGGAISAGMTVTGAGIQAATTVASVAASGSVSFVTLNKAVSGALGADVVFGSSGTSIAGSHGTLMLQQDGSYTYTITDSTPTAGSDTFSYEITDAAGAVSTARLSLDIIVSNVAPPVAAPDTVAITENAAAVSANVLANDTQNSGVKVVSDAWSATAGAMTAVTVAGVSLSGLYGALLIKPDGSTTYTLNNGNGAVNALRAGQSLSESFSYRMGSNTVGYDVETLTITISGANDGPSAFGDSATAREAGGLANTSAGFDPAGNVLLNDADPDSGDAKTVTMGGVATPSGAVAGGTTSGTGLVITGTYGALRLGADGSYSYVVDNTNATVQALGAASAGLTDSFSYRMRDTAGSVSDAVMVLTVTGANDAPVNATPAAASVAEGASAAIPGLSVGDVDDASLNVALSAGFGALTIGALNGAAISAGANGSATLTLSGSPASLNLALATLSYQGAGQFSGTDTLSILTTDAAGLVDLDTVDITVTPDNRLLTVTAPTVNEASQYAVFSVAGAAGQQVTLALAETGGGAGRADDGADFASNLEYFDGAAWQAYAGNTVALPAGGTLFVRVAVLADLADEGAETFQLTAANKAGSAASAVATIVDNGTGLVYSGGITGGIPDSTTAGRDDDRALAVTSVSVNENSPYAVFTLTGAGGQAVGLALVNGSATDADHGAGIEYFDGAAWQNYAGSLTLPAGGAVFLRTSIATDAVYEGPESFAVVATNLSGRAFVGNALISDDGTGTVYPGTISGGMIDTSTAGLDNDLALAITAYGPINEASGYAMFSVTATAGEVLTLTLAASGNTPAATAGFTMEFSTDGASWTAYDSSTQPVAPAGGVVFVRISISSEHDAVFEGAEAFQLTAAIGTGSGKIAAATTAIVDDGTGSRYDGTIVAGTPVAATNGLDYDTGVDNTAPAIAVASDMATLAAGQTATISFILSEPSTTFSIADIAVTGGLLSGFTGNGASYSAMFTPDAGSTTAAVISVASAVFTDAAGNANTDGADSDNTVSMSVNTVVTDTAAPTIAIASDMAALGMGQTAAISFTLSEPSTSFAAADISVSGGTLSGFTGSGTSYSALFTPTADSTAAAVISVASNAFTDAAGNANADGADTDNTVSMAVSTFVPDTTAPTISITSDMASLGVGQTAAISFTLSEPSATFTDADILVTGGILSGLTGNGASYTALFTPTAGSTTAAVISVASNAFTDAAGNANADGGDTDNTVTMAVNTVVPDTTAPTIAITSDMAALGVGQTAAMSFNLSEPSTSFSEADISVSGGTLSGFTGSGASYSALFTPTAGSTTAAVISVATNALADAAGNANADGADTDNTVSMAVNTVVPDITAPTVVITSNATALLAGQSTSITFTLSESSTSFTAADVAVTGGTLSGFTGSGANYSATFSAGPLTNANATISVASASFTDAAGNANAVGGQTSVQVTRAALTAPTIAIAEDSNNDGRLNTAELAGDVDVIITLPTGALAGDVLTVSDGSATRTIVLTGQSIASGSVFTAFAPPARGAAISVSASISEAGGQPGAIAQDSAQRGSGAVFAITGVSSDTGIVGDLVTTDNTLVLSGTAETGTVVKVMLGGVLLGTTVAANDSWEFDNTANPLPNGDNVLTVTADDLPGQMPAIVVRVFSADLNPVSDDGANNTDHRTSITMPDFILKASGIMATGDTARLVDASGAVIGSSAVTAANVASGQVNVTTQPLDDGAYIFLAQIVGADGQVKVADQVTVTIITDQDGVKPSVELAANGGDFNHDGLFDWQQNNLAQLPLTSLEAFVAGINAPDSSFGAIMAGAINAGNPGAPVLLDAGAQLLNVAVSAQPAPLPANTTAATPMFEFSVTGYDGQALRDIAPSIPGLQTRVIIDLPAGVQANTFLKFDPAAQSWYTFKDDQNLATFDDGATLLDTNADGLVDRIVVTLTDGARGDEDGIANGVVVDPGMLAFQSANPVYSILLAGGDRFYTTNAAEAAQYATGAGNVFEGARFDSLSAGDGGRKMYASYQQYTRDWWFGADQQPAPYICYERVSTASGFFAAGASGSVGEKFHLFMDGAGITQLVTQAQASTLGLATKGYTDKGAQFSTTTNSAFAFDAEGYLVANRGNADVQAFVRTLAGKFQHSSDVGFVEAVEQHYLGQVAIVGLAHGGAASAAELNTAFGTSFLG